jgi:hypothetical protein
MNPIASIESRAWRVRRFQWLVRQTSCDPAAPTEPGIEPATSTQRLDPDVGTGEIEDILSQIEHGVVG